MTNTIVDMTAMEWQARANATARDVPETTLAALLQSAFARTPDAPALTFGDTTWNYAELDRRTGALAAALRARGVVAERTVAIALPRGPELMVAILAVIRAGGAYVPLNVDDPEARRADIMSECEPVVLLAEEACGPTPLFAPSQWPQDGTCPDPDDVAPTNLAYVMYTSGSTGKPKGVMIEHRQIINRLLWMAEVYEFGPEDRALQKTPVTFDVSLWELFTSFLTGGELVVAPHGAHRDPREMLALIRKHDITAVHFIPTMLSLFLDVAEGEDLSIRRVFASGEALRPDLRDRFHRVLTAELHNLYGPTEASVEVSYWNAGPDDDANPMPIGFPVWNTRLYVLNEDREPLLPGEQGRLWLAGRQIARGYLNRDDLTAERFVDDPFVPGERMYDSGDIAEWRPDGAVVYHGRADTQIKIRGIRLELGEVESALEAQPGIRQAVVVARDDLGGGELRLAAFCTSDAPVDEAALRDRLADILPGHAVPSRILKIDALPFGSAGKVDRRALTERPIQKARAASSGTSAGASATTARVIAEALGDILGMDPAEIDRGANFFDLGANSIQLVRLRETLRTELQQDFPVSDFFLYTNVNALARHLGGEAETAGKATVAKSRSARTDMIAIVGMAGRFPGAQSVDAFWQGLVEGREMISHFSEDELDFDPRATNPGTEYVMSRGIMQDPEMFDARHFGIPPREADRLDPQHRIMLEVAQTALEDAGHDPDRFGGRIGMFCGSSQSSYLLNNLLGAPGAARELAAGYPVKDFATAFGNDKDFLATRLAYKLNLTGPALTVQTACSTALTAVAQACEALRAGHADMALAGAVSVTFPTKRPYAYLPEGMASADGHCRTFDAQASGTVFGDGAGLVVLRRLDDALEDGDEIIAVIRGLGINNDGADKAGYAAPSIRAQTDVIQAAHRAAGITPRQVGYVEAHGTATPLGDPIEFTALQAAFGAETDDRNFCALGSAKTNIGHLDIAAGAAGLIKAALVLKHGKIPPLLHYTAPNPRIDFENSAFDPVAELRDWPRGDTPRIAGVSAFGVGGTNVHVVLEEAPETEAAEPEASTAPRLFPISGSAPEAVAEAVAQLGAFAKANPEADPDRVVATLRHGRRQFANRTVLVARDMAELAEVAAAHKSRGLKSATRNQLAFLFPGQGAQHVGMARHLFQEAPVFREALSLCTELLEPELGLNLLDIIHAPDDQAEEMTERLKDTALAQPAIFATSYALAKQWDHWGIAPDAMVGHSIGEFAAATIAGVMDVRDALKLIALRGRLMADLPRGVMVSVRASEDEVMPYLGAGLDLAAVNGAKAVVIAGPEDAADAILPKLEADGMVASRLHTSHAFHSHMMEPALAPFREAVAALDLYPPTTPILSTVTGDWLTDDEATDPDYWASHMRRPVRFHDAIQVLWSEGQHMFLESGPGRTLSTLAGQNPDRGRAQPALASLPHAQAADADSHVAMLESFGQLWSVGWPVDWRRVDEGRPEAARMRGLPTYPFQRKRHWIEPVELSADAMAAVQNSEAEAPVADAAPLPPADAGAAIRDMLADLSGIDPEEMDGSSTFLELGFDSLLLTQATREITDRFGVTITLRELIDGLPNIDALAAHIEEHGNLEGTAPADKTKVGWMAEIERPDAETSEKVEETAAAPSSAPMTTIGRDVEEIRPEQRAHIERVVARFNAKTAKSKALTQEYRPYHADPRTASGFNRLWKEAVYQIVSDRSKGSRIIDVDGNEYVDLLNGFGPGFLGHTHDLINGAIADRMAKGYEVGPQHQVAMEAARLFCEVTGNERASFVCTGSEAVYAAMRLSRTVTGRDTIVIFQRDYHGNFDEVLVRGLDGQGGLRTLPIAPGIPRDAVKNIVVLPYGTPQSLDWIRSHADTLAAVVIEPVQSRRPEFRPVEFVREIRRITERAGALMVFDEVVTGFRFGPRGAQGYFGVEADLVTYGKIVGAEMPVGVVSGKARYMDTFDGGQWAYGDDSFPEAPVTFFAGTFVRHPLVMAAVRAMLTYLKAQPDLFWHTINAKGDKLAGTVNRWFRDNDMPLELPNCGSLMYLRIGEDQKFGGLYGVHLRERGLFLLEGFPSYVTAAHDDEDLEFAIDVFKDAALEMRADGMFSGRDAVAHEGPQVTAPPPRLLLPDGPSQIASAMSAPLGPLHVPTTAAQREIWAALQFTPELNPAYNESARLDLHGALDADKLRDAMHAVIRRHDALRSTFSDDGAFMVIRPDMEIDVPLADLSGQDGAQDALAAILRRHVEEPFDLENGPLIRAELVRIASDHHVLVITAHHIVCDGWSIDVVSRDLGTIYGALVEGVPPRLEPVQSIIDYTQAEAAWQDTEEAARVRDFWRAQYADDVPVIDLPTDHPRGAARGVRGDRLDLALSPELTSRLRAVARRENLTFVTLLFAAWTLQMSRLAGTEDMVVGMPTAGQSARGMPGVVGHCVHFLPIRASVPAEATVRSYVQTARHTLLDALEHQTFTFGELVRELQIKREEGRPTLVPLVFNYDMGIDLSQLSYGSASSTLETNPRAYETFEIFLNLTDRDTDILTEWSYNAELFERSTMARYAEGFRELLEAFAEADFDGRLGALSDLSEADRRTLLVDWQGKPAEFPSDKTLGQVFAERVAVDPDATAVIDGEEVISFARLDGMADALAARLEAAGVGSGDRVGLCLDRSAGLVASMVAAFKLGAMFVPLGPTLPKARIDYLLSDSGAKAVIANTHHHKEFGFDDPILVEDIDAAEIAAAQARAPVAMDPAGGAYVAYTSGSTGQPKGVVGTHRATLNRFAWMWREYPFADDEVMCQKTAISFVDSIWEILGPLLAGVPQVVIPQEVVTEPRRFLEMLGQQRVTRLLVVPSLLRVLVESDLSLEKLAPSLRLLFTSGERLPGDLARRFLETAPGVTLINLYGSSEVAADVTVHEITADDLVAGEAPIGRPIDNIRLYVLDADRKPVPIGATGELYVGGAGLAAGYFGQDDLTAERFLPDPFDDTSGARMFRTGDLVQYRADGALIFRGRSDSQVKLRGFRIELGEVEAAMTGIAGIGEAAVIVLGEDPDIMLCAFVTPAAGADRMPEPNELRAELARSLPGYMVPGHIQVISQMPLNASGKTDRRALPALFEAQAGESRSDPVGPATATERQLQEIWQRLFKGRKVDVEDNFFDIGGHSLMAVALFDRIRKEIGQDLPIATLLRHQTIRDLAAELDRAAAVARDAVDVVPFDQAPPAANLVGLADDWDTTTVIHPGPDNGTRRPVFMVGGVGGNVNNLFELGRHLGQSRPVIGFQTRGVLGHKPHETIEDMAAENIRYMRQHQPEGPYILAGYSGGAYTALEMARQLEAAGEKIHHLVALDVYAPHFRDKFHANYRPTLGDRLSGEMSLLRNEGLGTLFNRVKAQLRTRLLRGPILHLVKRFSLANYRFRIMQETWWAAAAKYRGGPIDGPITLFIARPTSQLERAAVALDPTLGWRDLTPESRFRRIEVEGNHLDMLTGERVARFAADFERSIQGPLSEAAE